MPIDAFVTAGGRISGGFAEKAGTQIKAMVEIGGETMMKRTIDALKNCDLVGRVAVVAPLEIMEHPDVKRADLIIRADGDGVENIKKGLNAFPDSERVILCTSDLPFINSEAVEGFIDKCPVECALCYPVFEENDIDEGIRAGVPGYVKLKEGRFTGGSMFMMNREKCLQRLDTIGQSFNARKSTLGMARLLGLRVIVETIFGVCKLQTMEDRVARLMGAPCKVIRGCDPVITVDVDDEESYEFALKYADGIMA